MSCSSGSEGPSRSALDAPPCFRHHRHPSRWSWQGADIAWASDLPPTGRRWPSRGRPRSEAQAVADADIDLRLVAVEGLADPDIVGDAGCRADVLLAIRERVKAWDLTQEVAAARLGLTRPRLNDLMRGKLDKFSLDALISIAAAAGFRLHIELEDVQAA